MSTVYNRMGRLHRWIDRRLEVPLILLGIAWLILLVVEQWRGESAELTLLSNAIWVIFLIEFVIRLATARDRIAFLRRNWIAAVSLLVPALRVLRILRVARILRAARVTRGLRLVRVLTRVNRAMNSLARILRRRGFGYVVLATVLVALGGGAGMYAFERDAGTFESLAEAIWWTAMLLTTMGSEQWPATWEGRILCLMLSIFGFAVFGYVTATLATWFIGTDSKRASGLEKNSAQAG